MRTAFMRSRCRSRRGPRFCLGVRLARHRDARRPREDELEQALGLADEDGAVEAGGALCDLRAALALEGDRPARRPSTPSSTP